jgi:signal peptidase I
MIHPPPEPPRDPAPIIPGLPRNARRWLVEVIQMVAIAALLYLVLSSQVMQPYQVVLRSMQPTLEPQDRLLVDRLTPRWNAYARGDIIVFAPPSPHDAHAKAFVKRVIGIAGDTVFIESGQVWIAPDGGAPRRVDEPYVSTGPTLPRGEGAATSWVVPSNELFVLGDNRGRSVDSRTFGPIDVNRVVGRVALRYLPLSRIGFVASGD